MTSIFNRPRLLLTVTSLFWAGNVVVGRAIVGVIPPVTLACLRWMLASLFLLPFAWLHLKGDAEKIAGSWRTLLFLGFVGPALYNSLSYLGLVFTSALNGLVLNAAAPMAIALVAWSLFGDRPNPAQFAGMFTGFAGVLVVITKGDLTSLAAFSFNRGDLMLLTGMLAWSIYTAVLRKRPAIQWQSYNFITYAIAALVNIPLAVTEHALGHTMSVNWTTAAAVGYVAIFPSLLAYIFYNRGVELLGPAQAGLYLFLIPIFGALLAMIFLGEQLHLFHALGFALIIAGVLMGSQKEIMARLASSD